MEVYNIMENEFSYTGYLLTRNDSIAYAKRYTADCALDYGGWIALGEILRRYEGVREAFKCAIAANDCKQVEQYIEGYKKGKVEVLEEQLANTFPLRVIRRYSLRRELRNLNLPWKDRVFDAQLWGTVLGMCLKVSDPYLNDYGRDVLIYANSNQQ